MHLCLAARLLLIHEKKEKKKEKKKKKKEEKRRRKRKKKKKKQSPQIRQMGCWVSLSPLPPIPHPHLLLLSNIPNQYIPV